MCIYLKKKRNLVYLMPNIDKIRNYAERDVTVAKEYLDKFVITNLTLIKKSSNLYGHICSGTYLQYSIINL